tara:strand:+ start:286 stop:507 length:222 start_codon:yes stop_codon:yes gene_type:complete
MKLKIEELLEDFKKTVDTAKELANIVVANSTKYSDPNIRSEVEELMKDPRFIELANESNHVVGQLANVLGFRQ